MKGFLPRLMLAAPAIGWILSGEPQAQPGPDRARAARVVLLSVDAGADWILDRLIERGKAPAFAAIARDGARADAMISVLPTLTAPAHATLWTGAYPSVHGVAGNYVRLLPRAEHTVLERQSGFESRPLRAEPIWLTAAKEGRQVLVAQATGGFPFTHSYPDRLLQFDVYANQLARDAVVEGTLAGGVYRLAIEDAEFTLEALGGESAMRVRSAGAQARLVAGRLGRFSPPLPITIRGRGASIRLRLMSYDDASGAFKLYRGRVFQITSSDPARLTEFQAAAGAAIGEGVAGLYRDGTLGPTLADGGGGEAESWLTEFLQANQEYFEGILTYAASRPWELLVLYLPSFDPAAHALTGMIDPASFKYSADLAARVWPALEHLFAVTVDRYVADIRQRFPDATLVIGSDHGMEGTGRWVFPNVALRRAGLLSLDAEGRIDLARTQAVHLPDSGGGVFVNADDWKGGIVAKPALADVKRRVTAALLAIRDPANGAAPVRAVFDVERDGAGLGFGGPAAADLHFDLSPGYQETANPAGDRDVADDGSTGDGDHGAPPWHRNLHAIFYAVGPQVGSGRRIPVVRSIDVAPTVARLLGIAPPADAMGVAIPLR